MAPCARIIAVLCVRLLLCPPVPPLRLSPPPPLPPLLYGAQVFPPHLSQLRHHLYPRHRNSQALLHSRRPPPSLPRRLPLLPHPPQTRSLPHRPLPLSCPHLFR